MRHHIQSLRTWIRTYRHILMPASLVLGFVIDSLTLRRVAGLFENVAMISYLVILASAIVTVNYLRDKENKSQFLEKVYLFAPFVIEFVFGGLFSGFTVFYFRSGSLSSSWFFLIILFVLMLGNEFFKKRYQHLAFQIATFYTGLFFYLIFAVPILLGRFGPGVFILAGMASIGIIALCMRGLVKIVPAQVRQHAKLFIVAIGSVFVFINILYFTNIIPPIPLALKKGEAYYQVARTGTGYRVVDEAHRGIFNFHKTLTITPSDPVYIYSSVFAPKNITTDIVHRWQYDDPEKGWTTETVINFPISGGREEGYRTYSYKSSTKEGKWRVRVETDRGQVIGVIGFEIKYGIQPQLKEMSL